MLYNTNSYTKLLDLIISSLTIIKDFDFITSYNQGTVVNPIDKEQLNKRIAELTSYRDQLIRDFTNSFNSSPEILKIINDIDQ